MSSALALDGFATSPGRNGRIAFKHYLDSGRGTGAIFTIDANGSVPRVDLHGHALRELKVGGSDND